MSIAAFAIAAALLFGGAPPAQAAGGVSVLLDCEGRFGSYAWNAGYHGMTKNTNYNVYTKVSIDPVDGSGGSSSFDWVKVGVTRSGNLGIGSTNTYYSNLAKKSVVKLQVKINGAVGSSTKTCG